MKRNPLSREKRKSEQNVFINQEPHASRFLDYSAKEKRTLKLLLPPSLQILMIWINYMLLALSVVDFLWLLFRFEIPAKSAKNSHGSGYNSIVAVFVTRYLLC